MQEGAWRPLPPSAVAEAVWECYNAGDVRGTDIHWFVPEELEKLVVQPRYPVAETYKMEPLELAPRLDADHIPVAAIRRHSLSRGARGGCVHRRSSAGPGSRVLRLLGHDDLRGRGILQIRLRIELWPTIRRARHLGIAT